MIHSDILRVPGHEVPLNKPLHALLYVLRRDGESTETHHLAAQRTVDDTLATLHDAHNECIQDVCAIANNLDTNKQT